MPKIRRKFRLSSLLSRRLILAGLVLLVVAGVGLALTRRGNDSPGSTDDAVAEEAYVNLEPPTEEEKQQAENRKDEIVAQNENQSSPSTSPDGKKQVTPVITGSDENFVRAYIPGVVEEGGTCTSSLSKSGSQTVTASSEGVANVSQTVCAIDISNKSLTAGQWSVVVSYSSSASEGKSAAYSMVVN